MINKLIRKFLLIIIVTILLIGSVNISNISIAASDIASQLRAAGGGGANLSRTTSEALYRTGLPVDAPPGPPGVTSNGFSPSVTIKQRILTLTAQRKIEGNAFEDIPRLVEKSNSLTSSLSTKQINTNAAKDADEPAISDIVVELLNNKDEVIKTTKTDNSGHYVFDFDNDIDLRNEEPGMYKLRFYYGLVNSEKYLPEETEGEDYVLPDEETFEYGEFDSYSKIKNILKYNGQDYFASAVGNAYNANNYFRRRILESGKAFSQVYILIDCSSSVTQRILDGDKTVFDLEKEAAIEAINRLLPEGEENNNVAIGIAGFFNDIINLMDLTSDKQQLIDLINSLVLDEDDNGWVVGDEETEVIEINSFTNLDESLGTNIGTALEKTKNLFVTDSNYLEESNRNIILISDGYPSAHKKLAEPIYKEDAYDLELLVDKYVQIVEYTNEDIKNIINDGINLISIISKPEEDESTENYDPFARILIDATFKNQETGDYYGYYKEISRDNEEEYKNYFANEVTQIVKSNYEEGTILSDITEEGILTEIRRLATRDRENEERRFQINNYFSIIDNQKATWFNNVEKLQGNIVADGLMFENTAGYVEFVKEFTKRTYMYIDSTPYEITTIEEDDDNVYYVSSKGTETYIKSDWDKINLNTGGGYTNQNLVFEKRSPFRLKLEKFVSGIRITLADETVLYDKTTDIPSDMLTIPITMDDEIIHGAKVEIEYTIRINNISDTNIQTGPEISVLDYFNLEGNSLQYDPDTNLLTEPNRTNRYYLWETVKKEDLQGIVNSDVYDKLVEGNEYLKVEYTVSEYQQAQENNEEYPVNPVIGKNGHIDIKIVGTTTLSSALEADDLTYSNTAEILKYSNLNGRRIDYETNREEVQNGEEPILKFLSDNPDETITPGNYKLGDAHQEDSATSPVVAIIPPFGEKIIQYALPIILGIVFVAGLIFIKKKVLK